jgi:predicted ribosome quality control (RQC) complex YloA/Tae2 family protein
MIFPLSDAELAEVVAELAPRLLGEVAGKVWQPDEHTLILELGRDRLLLSTHPKLARMHLAPRAQSPANPPSFAMLLRKRLGGRRLQALEVTPGDRVVRLGFGDETLMAELTPPHADVLLVADVVVASLRGHALGAPYQTSRRRRHPSARAGEGAGASARARASPSGSPRPPRRPSRPSA